MQSNGGGGYLAYFQPFSSQLEAFIYGATYNFENNSWANTHYGDFQTSLHNFLYSAQSGEHS